MYWITFDCSESPKLVQNGGGQSFNHGEHTVQTQSQDHEEKQEWHQWRYRSSHMIHFGNSFRKSNKCQRWSRSNHIFDIHSTICEKCECWERYEFWERLEFSRKMRILRKKWILRKMRILGKMWISKKMWIFTKMWISKKMWIFKKMGIKCEF